MANKRYKDREIASHGSKVIPKARMQEYVRSSTIRGEGHMTRRGHRNGERLIEFNDEVDEVERKGTGNDTR
jgi:hypothetical protein